MRKSFIHKPRSIQQFSKNLAHVVADSNIGVLLRGSDSFTIPKTNESSRFQLAAAIGARKVCCPVSHHFDELDSFLINANDWVFGYFGYDLKNQLERLSSSNPDSIGFPDMFFFYPSIVIICRNDVAEFLYFPDEISIDDIQKLIKIVEDEVYIDEIVQQSISFNSRFSKTKYLQTIEEVKRHIARGDIYEMNLCQEFFTSNATISPAGVFNRLYDKSPTPFGAFFRYNEKYLLCASLERYLRKSGALLVSQPIKGTAPRMKSEPDDIKAMERLRTDPKERAENVMIVDLVRNDLSRIAKRGSVRVNELCGIYNFPQVHQMISTVSCELADGLRPTDSIRATFPMGSMTGAPKVRAMELIEQFERSQRGLYSGAVGYFAPNGDFDFNVVIRSLLYNSANGYLSFTVGGAITFKSIPEAEYDECLVKARAILDTLNARLNVAE